MPKWILSPITLDELDAILSFVQEESGSPLTADRLLDEFRDAFDALAGTPNMGFHRHDLTGMNVRWWPLHRYLIVYDPDAIPLRIIRVIHGARLIDPLFNDPVED